MLAPAVSAMVLLAVVLTGCGAGQGATEPAGAPATPTSTAAEATATPVRAEVSVERYGEAASQFGELWHVTPTSPRPVVVLIHGGFWQDRFGLGLMDPLAEDLVTRGYAVWNIEYRRVGPDGGGWPTTFDDVAAAIDHLTQLGERYELDLERIAFVGHSAGGHLALWAAGREAIPAGEPWAEPAIVPDLTVGQAPVVDLTRASAENAGGAAVDAFLGGPVDAYPERFAAATPDPDVSGRLLIVLGADDRIVAPQWAGGAPAFEAAQVEVADTDHFDVIDPAHPSWKVVVDALAEVIDAPG